MKKITGSGSKDVRFMQEALMLAEKAQDMTYPNPMVGACIVRNGTIIGRGYHRKAGEPHAEVMAIRDARSCKGARMYVTLEPCDHYGKTPPCTGALIKSGIKEVVIAMVDPNQINRGRGTKRLKSAGIRVRSGICGKEAAFLNRKYIKYVTKGLPYITLKTAQSLDGKIAARDGSSKWITSGFSRLSARKERNSYDAIMVGVNTVLKDDPHLLAGRRRGKALTRIIVDSRLRTPHNSNIVRTGEKAPVLIAATGSAARAKAEKLREAGGVEIMTVRSSGGRVQMRGLLKQLARRGFVNILAEGGGELAGSLFDGGFVDEVRTYISPKLLGGTKSAILGRGVPNIKDAVKLSHVEVERYGEDVLIRGLVRKGR